MTDTSAFESEIDRLPISSTALKLFHQRWYEVFHQRWYEVCESE